MSSSSPIKADTRGDEHDAQGLGWIAILRLGLVQTALGAIVVLTFGLYFPRHRRKGMVAAYLGANIGVLAVADALSSSTITAEMPLGPSPPVRHITT